MVSCDVVVVLCVRSEAQPEMNARATTATQERIIFFISMFVISMFVVRMFS